MQPLYSFSGIVIQGAKRGKTLGFPTANVLLEKQIPEGIYASDMDINGKTYHAATFIGKSETFDEKEYKAESYILDFDQNIYEKNVTVKLFKKLRDNQKFNSREELIEQMKKDVLGTVSFFSKTS